MSPSDSTFDQFVKSILDSIVAGVIIIDQQMRITTWNTWMEQTSDISAAQAIGQRITELFPQLENTRIDKAAHAAIEQGNSALISHALMTQPFPLHSDNGSSLKQMIYIKPILMNTQSFAMIQINDVTAAVRRESELRKATKEALRAKQMAEELSELKSSFISTVSHELRTPLTSIRGTISLLRNNVLGEISEEAKPMLAIADRNGERLLYLINDLLDMEKLESGVVEYHFEPVELSTFLTKCIEENQAYADRLKVSYQIVGEIPSVTIPADANRLAQAITNLLSNAAKFEPDGGTIEVKTELIEKNDSVRISITDHGEGVPEEFKSRIFEKFSQAETTDDRRKGGTGLGLAISNAIIDSHNGFISYESEPNVSTTFYVELPLHQD